MQIYHKGYTQPIIMNECKSLIALLKNSKNGKMSFRFTCLYNTCFNFAESFLGTIT